MSPLLSRASRLVQLQRHSGTPGHKESMSACRCARNPEMKGLDEEEMQCKANNREEEKEVKRPSSVCRTNNMMGS